MHHRLTPELARAVQADRVAAAARRRPPADAGDLERLVAGAAAGDPSAWAALVARFEPYLLRVARSHGLSRHEAEDAVQDTWMRLLHNIGRVREPRALAGWLTTTARHESLRVRERARREKPTAEDPRAEVADATKDDVEVRLDAAARRIELTGALAALPPRHARIMRALFSDTAPSYDEIAAQLRVPIGSIGPIRSRCLAKLRLNGRLRQVADPVT
jgi:RNA polymerase sigma factor (sigma-70 family)